MLPQSDPAVVSHFDGSAASTQCRQKSRSAFAILNAPCFIHLVPCAIDLPKATIALELILVAKEKIPVQRVEGTSIVADFFLHIKAAVPAVVRHLVDIVAACRPNVAIRHNAPKVVDGCRCLRPLIRLLELSAAIGLCLCRTWHLVQPVGPVHLCHRVDVHSIAYASDIDLADFCKRCLLVPFSRCAGNQD